MIRVSEIDKVLRFDIARTLLGRGFYWTAAYYVDGLLVDSGCAYAASELLEVLRGRPVKYLINTHSHEDHIGGNALLQENYKDLQILAHPRALPVLRDTVKNQPLQFYRRFMWGYPQPSRGSGVADGEIISTERYNFQVLYTPGHSDDHLCLYEPEQGWIFTGDLFVGGREQVLRTDYNIWQVITSLKKVQELPLKIMFPGSARIRMNPQSDMREKIQYLEELGVEILNLHRQGLSPASIARKLLKKQWFLELFTGGHFSRKNLVQAFLNRKDTPGKHPDL